MSIASDSPSPAEDRCWSKAKELFGDSAPERSAVDAKLDSAPPKVLKHIGPTFPEGIRVPRSSCLHLLHEALVSPSGDVVALWPRRRKSEDACAQFEEIASSAIRQWKYSPLLMGRRAVPFCMMVSTTIDVR